MEIVHRLGCLKYMYICVTFVGLKYQPGDRVGGDGGHCHALLLCGLTSFQSTPSTLSFDFMNTSSMMPVVPELNKGQLSFV